MCQINMKTLGLGILVLFINAQLAVEAKQAKCWKTYYVEPSSSYYFTSHRKYPAQKYPNNKECEYYFRPTDTCPMMKMYCSNVNLKGNSKCNDRQDMLEINGVGYCNGEKPPMNPTEYLDVTFSTNAKRKWTGESAGFYCEVTCYDEA